MENKFTPGPWKVDKYTTRTGIEQTIIKQEPDGRQTFNVCRMDIAARSQRTLEADARLIATAPSMWEWLGRVADALCTCEWLLPSYSALDPADHAPECPYRLAATRPTGEEVEAV